MMTLTKSPKTGSKTTADNDASEDVGQDDAGSNLDKSDTSESEHDIVITGISCRLPRCGNMSEFRDHLLSAVDMKDSADSNDYGSEFWNGLRHTDKFDASFFGMNDKEADCMDPQLRMLLEIATEAIFDAGIEPSSLSDERVGVYIGAGPDHTKEAWCTNPNNLNQFATTGNSKHTIASKMSQLMNLKGPSYCIQGSDAASCVALDRAYQDMVTGEIDTALVGGSSLSFKPASILKYRQQGLLSDGFISRPFDAKADGFVGGDGVVAMVLQYKTDAKRIYAAILHCQSVISPTEPSGLSYASTVNQADFLRDVYAEVGIDPRYMEYIELHASGIPKSDVAEIEAVSSVLCSDRVSPLLIGSVKSHTGHTLATSGLVSIAKLLVSFEEGMIPANRNVSYINPHITLKCPKMQIVTENIRPLVRLFGMNNLGFGGYHAHCILDGNVNPRMLHYMASKMTRLCVYCGRTKNGVNKALKFLYDNREDVELQALSNETARMSPSKMPYRGFCLLNCEEKALQIQRCSSRSVDRPVWFVFSGMGTQWPGMGRKMMELATFKSSILESSKELQQYGINLYKLIMEGADNTFERPLNSFIVITAIQIALVKFLKDMGVVPDGMVGHSSGEIACGYANGCLTAREAILAAYWEGFCIQELDPLPGAMAAVGLTWNEAKRQCPDGVVPACHNAENTVTVSGPVDKVHKFVQQLKDLGIFTREVKSAGVAFHSPAINDVVPLLREYLSKLIDPKPKTSAWISTSVPEDHWHTDLNKKCSVDYLVNNLTSPVLFQEALEHIPSNSIVLEVGPHDLLQTILKRSLDKDIYHVGLMKRHHPNNVAYFFKSLGKCYIEGVDLNPLGVFPPIDFPVPQGTPGLSSLVEWDHSKSWSIPQPEDFLGGGHGQWSQSRLSYDARPDGKDSQLTGHMISGRCLFPAAGFVIMVWKAVARYFGKVHQEVPITVEDLKIHKQVVIPETECLVFDVSFIPLLGDFEITENNELIASGKMVNGGRQLISDRGMDKTEQELTLTQDDIYHEFKMRGYNYTGQYKSLTELDVNGESGCIAWNGDWMTYLDGMVQLFLLDNPSRSILLPNELKSVTINPELHRTIIQQQFGSVTLDKDVQSVISGGLCIRGLKTESVPDVKQLPARIGTLQFIPFEEVVSSEHYSLENHVMYGKICARIAAQCLSNLIQQADKVSTPIPFKADLEPYIAELEDAEKASDPDSTGDLNGPIRKYLEELRGISVDENYLHNVRNLRQDFDGFIQDDHVISSLGSTRTLKPCFDIVVENLECKNLRILEVCENKSSLLLHPALQRLETSEMTMECYISGNVQVNGCRKLDWKLEQKLPKSMQKFHLIVLDNVLCKQSDVTSSLANIVDSLEDNGFVLVKENTQEFLLVYALEGIGQGEVTQKGERTFGSWIDEDGWNKLFVGCGLNVVVKKQNGVMSTVFLLKKVAEEIRKETSSSDAVKLDIDLVDADSLETEWFENLTKRMTTVLGKCENDQSTDVCISDDPDSGIAGFVEQWRKNTSKRKIRLVHLESKSDDLCKSNIKTSRVFLRQYQKNLVSNIHRDCHWGTYHFLPITKVSMGKVQSTSAFVKGIGVPPTPTLVTKNMNSFVNHLNDTDLVTCYPRYCAISNESMAAVNGKHRSDMFSQLQRLTIHKKLGTGFSGYDDNGRRIMGISTEICPATKMNTEKYLTWELPDSWRLEDSCFVPSAYLMAYYSLFVHAGLKKDQALLISDKTDVSVAAVTIATKHCGQVFASSELFNMMLHSGNKPDCDLKTSLQVYKELDDVLRYTKGDGVDIILNTYSDHRIPISHLLKTGGHMINLDAEKKDLFTLDMEMIQKNCTVSCLTMDNLNEDDIRHVSELLCEGVKSGHVKPLPSIVYNYDKLQEAYSYKFTNMDCNVAVKFGEESHSGPVNVTARRILTCSPQKCYIINNSMTRFGLALAEWLIEHEATKLLLTTTYSKHGGYEKRKLQQWYSMGITVNVYYRNIQTVADTQAVVDEAKKCGPVGGVFYIPVIDGGDTASLSSICTSSTTYARDLDRVTRTSCNKTLDWFVVMPVLCLCEDFDQSAYSFVNTSLQRIVDHRTINGFPGLCVSLAGSGSRNNMTDVHTALIVLNSLEMLLQQSHPVIRLVMDEVCLSDKKDKTETPVEELFGTLRKLLDIKYLSRTMEHKLVMDICTDDEIIENIQELLKTTLDLNIACDGIKKMTVSDLKTVCNATDDEYNGVDVTRDNSEENKHVIQCIRNYSACIMKLNGVHNRHMPIYIVFDEDDFEDIVSLAGLIDCPVYGVSKSSRDVPVESIKCQAGYLVQNLYVNNNCESIILIGHKMACAVAIEMALQLQEADLNIVKHIICIEGSVQYVPLSDYHCFHQEAYKTLDAVKRENEALLAYMELYGELTEEILEAFDSIEPDLPLEQKVASLVPYLLATHNSGGTNLLQSEMQSRVLHYVYTYMLTGEYENCSKYKGNMTLIRGRGRPQDIKTPSDYYLSKVCKKGVSVHILNFGHTDFLSERLEEISHTVYALLHKIMSAGKT